MRTAVAGIPHFWEEDAVLEAATSLCRTTHSDPRCVASCAAVSVCVSRLLRGLDEVGSLEEDVIGPALEQAKALLATEGEGEAVEEDLARHSSALNLEELRLDETGRIGFTFKCLGSGLWALRSSGGFQEALNEVIRCGGDADTNGAVAGALLGCRLGFSQLPKQWVAGMPYASWLEAHAQKIIFMLGLR